MERLYSLCIARWMNRNVYYKGKQHYAYSLQSPILFASNVPSELSSIEALSYLASPAQKGAGGGGVYQGSAVAINQ